MIFLPESMVCLKGTRTPSSTGGHRNRADTVPTLTDCFGSFRLTRVIREFMIQVCTFSFVAPFPSLLTRSILTHRVEISWLERVPRVDVDVILFTTRSQC